MRYSFLSIAFLLLLSARSTFSFKVEPALKLAHSGLYQEAATKIQKEAYTPGRDQLAYLFDYAFLQQLAGNYEESNKAFHLADQISEEKDYISLKDQGSSLVLGEAMMSYKGDDYEKMLVNAFSAMNYAFLKQPESALVEVRRLNDKLNKYRMDSQRDYKDNPFVFYLSAMMWELEGKWDDALIDYEKTYQLQPGFSFVKQDLLYAAYKARNFDKLGKYKKEFDVKTYGKKQSQERESLGELVVIFYQGKGPLKRPNPAWFRLPILIPQSNLVTEVQVSYQEKLYSSESLVNLEKLAIDSLNEQYAALIAKRIAGKVVKNQIAQRIEKEDETLGLIARIAMDISDQADLRQWKSLPSSVHAMKIHLPEGDHNLSFQFKGSSVFKQKDVTVSLQKGKKSFLLLHSMD